MLIDLVVALVLLVCAWVVGVWSYALWAYFHPVPAVSNDAFLREGERELRREVVKYGGDRNSPPTVHWDVLTTSRIVILNQRLPRWTWITRPKEVTDLVELSEVVGTRVLPLGRRGFSLVLRMNHGYQYVNFGQREAASAWAAEIQGLIERDRAARSASKTLPSQPLSGSRRSIHHEGEGYQTHHPVRLAIIELAVIVVLALAIAGVTALGGAR